MADRIRGCLLAGAIGDALGAPIEFDPIGEIRRNHGDSGVTGFAARPYPAGWITDDTQMTLFTAEGLIESHRSGDPSPVDAVYRAYRRWLRTQDELFDSTVAPDGRLAGEQRLWVRRAPGNTCLGALRTGRVGTFAAPLNNSKGCGGVMRAAPAAFVRWADPFTVGAETAAITHGHPSGYWPAGALGGWCLSG